MAQLFQSFRDSDILALCDKAIFAHQHQTSKSLDLFWSYWKLNGPEIVLTELLYHSVDMKSNIDFGPGDKVVWKRGTCLNFFPTEADTVVAVSGLDLFVNY